MTASKIDITIEQGADFRKDFPIDDPSITYAELLSASAALQARTFADDPMALVTLTTANGGLTINAAKRIISAFIGWAATKALQPGCGVYDIKLLTASGKVWRPDQGAVTISPEVTTIQPPPPAAASLSYLLLGVY